ncbi:MAG: dTDP-4-dehydrorhamnose 3,5-epimerase [Desulfovibrio desulfuricans]|jgi:dTDP-4-dehydrorhamnose 3,5-epimerase|nr:dTDP-4-dehydrorhamnose 3,5-epimerase [Desulfovibrio desulfuricans]
MDIDESTAEDVGITGARLQPLAVIPTPGGPVLHMLRPGTALFPDFGEGFGEVYFSEVLPGRVKAWKRHTRQTQHFAVPVGRLKIVLYDDREHSPTRGVLCELEMGRPDRYGLLRIPVNVWYGFTAVGAAPALICNCADTPHDPGEGMRLPADDPSIPYRWEPEDAQ